MNLAGCIWPSSWWQALLWDQCRRVLGNPSKDQARNVHKSAHISGASSVGLL